MTHRAISQRIYSWLDQGTPALDPADIIDKKKALRGKPWVNLILHVFISRLTGDIEICPLTMPFTC